MKKLLTLLAISLAVVLSSCSTFDDEAIWNKLDDHESRISRLEEMCREMNSNIDALQTIVTALQTNDYVTSVTPVTKDGETVGSTWENNSYWDFTNQNNLHEGIDWMMDIAE